MGVPQRGGAPKPRREVKKMNDFDFNPVEYADEVYGLLKSISKDSLAFDLTVSALQKALQKAEEEVVEERRGCRHD